MTRLKLCLTVLALMPALPARPRPNNVTVIADRYRPLAFDQQRLAGMLAERLRANTEGYLERANEKAGQGGRLLEAAANAYEYTRHQPLKTVMDQAIATLLANDPRDISLLSGLLAYHRVTGDENALSAARKLGDLAVKSNSSSAKLQLAAPVMQPLLLLYRGTGDVRYLQLAKSIAAATLQSKGLSVDPTYENLSAMQGLIELYRVTGDKSYLSAATAAWNMLRVNRLTATGSLDSGDSCLTAAWMELNLNLLRATGEAQYAEQLERTIYNQLFAMQDVKSGAIYSKAPFNGTKQAATAADSCSSREAYGISLIPSAVWGRFGNGIAIALYSSGRATFKLRRRTTVQLYSEANYPEMGNIILHIDPNHDAQFPLRLRVPEWAVNFIADVGGSHLGGKPGDFLTINRTWRRGDTVKIAMDIPLRVLEGTGGQRNEVAIQRGPQVLALEKTQNPQIKDSAAASLVSTDPAQLKPRPLETKLVSTWTGDQAYAVSGEYAGKPQQLILVPFADAVSYRIWLRRPASPNH